MRSAFWFENNNKILFDICQIVNLTFIVTVCVIWKKVVLDQCYRSARNSIQTIKLVNLWKKFDQHIISFKVSIAVRKLPSVFYSYACFYKFRWAGASCRWGSYGWVARWVLWFFLKVNEFDGQWSRVTPQSADLFGNVFSENDEKQKINQ